MTDNATLTGQALLDDLETRYQAALKSGQHWKISADELLASYAMGRRNFWHIEANLREANLYGADLYGADLREANLYGANLYGADLYGADLYGADLREANLYGADLYGADLREANLYGADLREANLYGADLRGADLREANLYEADLYGANLYGAKNFASAGPVGQHRRIIYGGFDKDGSVYVQAGCRHDTPDAVVAAIERDYEAGPIRDAYIMAVRFLAATVETMRKAEPEEQVKS